MTKRILFLPNDIGGGLGHVRRSIRLAEVLQNTGYNIAFVCHLKKTKNLLNQFSNTFYIPFYTDKLATIALSKTKPIHPYPKTQIQRQSFFWEFSSYNYQVLRDGFFTRWITNQRFRGIVKKIDSFKPDLIFGDGHLLSYIIAKYFDIPVVQSTRFAIFPEKPELIWWKDVSRELVPPNSMQAFSTLLERIKLDFIHDSNELLKGNAYLVPGNLEIEPILTESKHLFYGYRVDSIKSSEKDPLTRSDKKNIFVTIGGGSGRSNLKAFYDFILGALANSSYNIIISDPFDVIQSSIESKNYQNLTVVKWVESSKIFPDLDLIIHHGGYSTSMEALWWGVPSLVVPSHTEQEGNGRRLEKLGAGKIMLLSKPADYQVVQFSSFYGDYTLLAGFTFDIKKEEFLSTIQDLVRNTDFKQNAVQQSEALKRQYSERRLINFIHDFC